MRAHRLVESHARRADVARGEVEDDLAEEQDVPVHGMRMFAEGGHGALKRVEVAREPGTDDGRGVDERPVRSRTLQG